VPLDCQHMVVTELDTLVARCDWCVVMEQPHWKEKLPMAPVSKIQPLRFECIEQEVVSKMRMVVLRQSWGQGHMS
jgi:hypothetical protein